MITINDVNVPTKEFAFDGCHKIYLVSSDEGRNELIGYGYTILPISDLPDVWENSCSLRFIGLDDANKSNIVNQFTDVVIKEV